MHWSLKALLLLAGAVPTLAPGVAYFVAHGRLGSGADIMNWLLGW